MEKKEYSEKYYGKSLCADCVHNFFNNGEGVNGCRAFPNGIPEEGRLGNNHKQTLTGQVGDFVFREAEYEELIPLAQYFWNIRHKQN